MESSENIIKVCVSCKNAHGTHQDKKCWFNQGSILYFAVSSHSFKRACNVQCSYHHHKSTQTQQVHHKYKITIKRKEGRKSGEWNKQKCGNQTCKIDSGCNLKYETRLIAVHISFFE